MNSHNVINSHFARLNTRAKMDEIEGSENFIRYMDLVFEEIKKASGAGKVALTLKLRHKLIKGYSIEVVSMILGLCLTKQNYKIGFNKIGKFMPVHAISIYWGVAGDEGEGDN